MFLFWAILGALIGYLASQKRGFSAVGGVLGGILLGPLAFLMFFISGIASKNEIGKKCPYCAEWVKSEATVCKHCGRDLPAAAGPAPRTARRTPSGKCSKCGHLLAATATRCSQCEALIQPSEASA